MPHRYQISNNERVKSRLRIFVAVLALLPIVFFAEILFGAVNIPLKSVAVSLFNFSSESDQYTLILQEIRMPRALLAAMIGALLASCGAATQGLFRNPLADPSLIGVTAGALVGGSLVIVLSASIATGIYALSSVAVGAFIGGALSVWLVYRFSTGPYGTSVATMLLAGIALTAIAGSLSNLLEFFSDDVRLRQISLWRMGGLNGASYAHVLIAGVITVITLVLLPKYSNALNALLLGESEARHLGINVNRAKTHLVIIVALGVGTSVALAGAIGFVGLIVPHIMRLLMGPDHRYLIPGSAIAGAILLLVSDLLSRVVLAPTEIPVGIITALIGAPVFVSLLKQRNASVQSA